jgi:hypothetical protein
MMPLNVVTNRGLVRSFSAPRAIEEKPWTIKESDTAPDVAALDHPKSAISGLKKTPKA